MTNALSAAGRADVAVEPDGDSPESSAAEAWEDEGGATRREGSLRGTGPGTDTGPSTFIAGEARTYADLRRARIRNRRLVGFGICIPLWVLSVVPLAREIAVGREGASLVLVYLAVGAGSLVAALAIRAVYLLLTKRPIWSPWMFPIAAFLAVAGYAGHTAGAPAPDASAPVAAPLTVDSADSA